ncbi:MAG TPA: hypothetical protein H9909_05310 [Candidatus Mediterraneibacter norfolkensis]|nr:hypothetical protein [Candidatus Mediterraneibacter norfolkensis]
MVKKRPTVGFMAIGLHSYWGQFEGMKEKCLHQHEVMKEKFDCRDIRLEDAGIVDSEDLARETGKMFREKKVDIVFCHMLTYAASVYIAPVMRELDASMILLNVQWGKSLDYDNVKGLGDWLGEGITCAGIPEATAVLRTLKKSYGIVTGYMEDKSVEQEIKEWCRAVSVKKKLAEGNLALFGRSFAGMMDLCVNETKIFEKFGTYIHHLDWQEIVDAGKTASSDQIEKEMQKIREIFEINEDMTEQDVRCIAETAEGFRKLAGEYNLHSIAGHYEFDAPESQADLLAAMNPALTILMTEGTGYAPEGDIRAALAMVILKELAGSAMMAELYSMDFNDDTCLVGHSGACDAAISSEKAVLKKGIFHGKKGTGYVTQFYPDKGPVTMLALTEDENGEYYLAAAEGECVDGPVLMLGDTNLRAKFPGGVKKFVNAWSMEGPTHHGVLAKGHHISELKRVADILRIPLKVIGAED